MTKTYKLVDKEDGEVTIVKYITNSCGCGSMGCSPDEIEIYEEGDMSDTPYRVPVESTEVNYVLQGLLDGDFTIR